MTSEQGGRGRQRLTATRTDLDVVRQRAFLVGVLTHGIKRASGEASLDELALLTESAGSDPAGEALLHRDRIDPAIFIGKGQAENIRAETAALDVDVVVFDNDLSPVQQRNLQAIFGCDVVDRTAVILDIFAQHATSKAGMLQVELAQLRYSLPRLTGKGTALSRLAGGIGTRGPGETKLETDRRRIATRIAKLERELAHIATVRDTQRKARSNADMMSIALVGYTNAGKSTLLNTLTGAETLTRDQLFSTLDATVRRLELVGEDVLVADTVGFVRDLPHELVQAFRSTLEEVVRADLLLHVVDASNADPDRQIESVREVLEEIGAGHVPEQIVFNKIDQAPPIAVERLRSLYPDSVAVSALERIGVDDVVAKIIEARDRDSQVMEFSIPYSRGEVLAALHRDGDVLTEDHQDAGTRVEVKISHSTAARYSEFRI